MAFKALDKLQINNTDVLTFDGTNIILSNVLVDDGVEISINSDNLTEGTTNRFFTPARETVLTNADIALDGRLDTLEGAGTGSVAKALVDAKAYADQAELDAIATANTYTDTAELDAIASANTYTDTAELDAISTAASDATTKADQALVDAKAYADTAVSGVANHSTTDTLTEGSTNLYYTNARADARAQAKIDALVGAAPAALDTLNELATALGDDANFSTTVTNQIAAITHDGLTGFVANEHIDWTAASAGTIDPSNYVNTNTGILSVVEDTTPQLGGNLDLQTYAITTSETGFDIITGSGLDQNAVGVGSITGTGYTGQGIGIASSTNAGTDILLLGDIDYTSGIYIGEFIGQIAIDNATTKAGWFGLSTVTVDSSAAVANTMFSADPQIILGNVGTSNAVSLAIGSGSDNRIHQLNGSGNTIFKFPAADGTTGQVLKTNGSGDISWAAQSSNTNTTYTAGNGLTLSGTEFLMSGGYTGNFTASGDITAYSDKRLKRNIETISDPLDIVTKLRGVKFEKDGRHGTGVIAQEVEEVLPEVVHTDAEGMKSVAYGNIVGVLIEAIKDQQAQIDDLISRLPK